MSDRIECIIDALRKKILEAAIRGELVPPNPEDEPASALIERVAAERQQLIREKKIKKPKTTSRIFRRDGHFYESVNGGVPVCIDDEIPFEIPDSWEWVRLGELMHNIEAGKNVRCEERPPLQNECGIVKVSSVSKGYFRETESKTCNRELWNSTLAIRNNDFLICRANTAELVGSCAIVERVGKSLMLSDKILRLRLFSSVNPQYILMALRCGSMREQIEKRATGTSPSMQNISQDAIKSLLLPLLPIQAQNRLVKTFEARVSLLAELQKSRMRYKQIIAGTPNSLRQQLIQEAIQGKLVPQDGSEEPASVLLERIAEERAKLGKKAAKPMSRIVRRGSETYEVSPDGTEKDISDEIPFEIPTNWEWARLGNLIQLKSGQDLTPDKYNSDKHGIPYITGASNFNEGKIIINRWTEHPKTIALEGELLLTCKGTVGSMAVLRESKAHIARQVMSLSFTPIIPEYLQFFLEASIEQLRFAAKGVIPGISRDDVMTLLFPLPPCSEQRSIAETLVALMSHIAL